MTDPETRLWVVFNGELYNHVELRDELRDLGHQFVSKSDTEVLLKAYAQWGTECLHRFNGMWAFALWDTHRQRLFCARDRFGEKHLYYRQCAGGQIIFASEVCPLLGVERQREGVEEPLVWDFLVFGLADHTEQTFFAGIRQLLPGQYFTAEPGKQPRNVDYYYVPLHETGENSVTLDEAAAQFRTLLEDSVRLRLRSDVPVASFFSGGLDSSSIVAMANRILSAARNGRLRTYTNTYGPEHPLDESARVAAVLPRLAHVDPVFIRVSPQAFDRDLLELVRCQEQPFHNASIFASFNLLRLIQERDRIKVVLAGEAGDELLGGYYRAYLSPFLGEFLTVKRLAGWWKEAHAWGVGFSLAATLKHGYPKLPARLRRVLLRAARPLPRLMKPDFFHAYASREAMWMELWRQGSLARRLQGDVMRFNLPQLLRHLDRNAMRFSIETRLPFLDHRLVEFLLSLPSRFRFHQGYSKYLARYAMADSLPPEIVWNKAKLGFGMAEQFWFARCADLLDGVARLGDFVNVQGLRKRLSSQNETVEQAYWRPVCLGLWLRVFSPGGASGVQADS